MTTEEKIRFKKRSDTFRGMLQLKIDTFRVWKEFYCEILAWVNEEFKAIVSHWERRIYFYNQFLFDDYMKREIDYLMNDVYQKFDEWYLKTYVEKARKVSKKRVG
ncbi:hypothetical protein SAMN02745116_02376 [Pilibacter termitis]|uniref:Uncharacterized protein n=1 Tax=Pilibacter termitis TaxID=263852 RepID=A0A1T4QZ78_9ENTE|nr:hypothetical protein [Pilibacter termitis]SKA08906.1 hypothetical protein SAMN02745116_02376 [Pilibacter termitis]